MEQDRELKHTYTLVWELYMKDVITNQEKDERVYEWYGITGHPCGTK